MFRLKEITEVVGGRLISGDPHLRIKGISIDSRAIRDEELFIAIKGNRLDGHDYIPEAIQKGAKAIIFHDASCCLVHRERISYIKVVNTRQAIADLARFHRQRFNIPIIAITGSNGKTTTKDMLAWILSSQTKVLKNPGTQNNYIGVSLALLKLDKSHRIGVLELGTNHFGEIAYLVGIAQPNIGIITNIGPAHLEHFKDLSGVYREKIDLLKGLKSPKIAILNVDDPHLRRLSNSKKNFTVTYGINNKCDFQARAVEFALNKNIKFIVNYTFFSKKKYFRRLKNHSVSLIPKLSIQLDTIGYANVYNALAVIAASRMFGVSYQRIIRRLKRFIFTPGRLSLVRLRHIPFIDDTYNANPASLAEALSALSRFRVLGRRIFVMGDMLELGSSAEEFHRQAGVKIARVCDVFIGVGKLARLAADWAVKFGLDKDCVFSCSDSQKANNLLYKRIKPDYRDLILVKGSRLMRMERLLR